MLTECLTINSKTANNEPTSNDSNVTFHLFDVFMFERYHQKTDQLPIHSRMWGKAVNSTGATAFISIAIALSSCNTRE